MNCGEMKSDSKRGATGIDLADDDPVASVRKAVANGRSKKIKVGSNGSVCQSPPVYQSWKSIPQRCSSLGCTKASDGLPIPNSFISASTGCVGSCAADIQTVQHSNVDRNEPVVSRRAKRKAQMCRNADMAYLDDVDWDILLHEQNFLVRNQLRDDSQRRSKKTNSYFADLPEAEEGTVAAVSAGLKACEVSPIEKIKFKDVLECKDGFQKYLQCRNYVLGLWNKDLKHILRLSDCGVNSTPVADESPQGSLVRNIYAFLDQSGYINTGVASQKGFAESCLEYNHQSQEVEDCRKSPCPLSESENRVSTYAIDQRGVIQDKHDALEDGRRIIIIGAGPAGLSAARHLQRHGFQVIVLEARDRIGGRVYTDRASLSVPVDLGASVITGYEADVSTQRRPDPSSLVCAQLGLDLTVLNSDCPIYDFVTGHKISEDVDKAVEEEYKSLLDDMVLMVAEKGENAMKMSLESGLECAQQRHCEGQCRKKCVEADMCKSACCVNGKVNSTMQALSPLKRRVMDWHFAHLEYGCAALLKEVSLPCWNQDDIYGGFGGAHCMIKGGYGTVIESLGDGLCIFLNHVVTGITYQKKNYVKRSNQHKKVKVSTSNGKDFFGDAVLITVPLGCLKRNSIEFSPPLPPWKYLSIQRLGFGVINKIVLEFPVVFWDDSVDFFGATAEETNKRGHCFMFWNLRKTVGAPVLVALVVGEAAVNGQKLNSSDHVKHALVVLRKLFGASMVRDPIASVVTDWGQDPYSYGAYSYVAVGASGEDYDILGRSVENCLFFAGEATCKEHPDTVGGAMMSGLREATNIMSILNTGSDFTTEVSDMEAAQRLASSERIEIRNIIKRLDEIRNIIRRLDVVKLSNVNKKSLDEAYNVAIEALEGMFSKAKSPSARLLLAKELSSRPGIEVEFCGTSKGLTTLKSWILDSLGKDGTKLLRQCLHLFQTVSTDVPAVRFSGIVKTLKDKVCVHRNCEICAISRRLVDVWVEAFRKEKSLNGGLTSRRRSSAGNHSRRNYTLSSVEVLDSRVVDDKECLASEEEESTLVAKGASRAADLAAAELITPSLEAPKGN